MIRIKEIPMSIMLTSGAFKYAINQLAAKNRGMPNSIPNAMPKSRKITGIMRRNRRLLGSFEILTLHRPRVKKDLIKKAKVIR